MGRLKNKSGGALSWPLRPQRPENWLLLIFVSIGTFWGLADPATGGVQTRLAGHVPTKRIAHARHLGRKPSTDLMKLSFVLNPSDGAGLDSFLKDLHDPKSASYHKFLSASEFADRFAPSQKDVNALRQSLESLGLSVKETHANRLVIEAEGTTATVESALQLEMHQFQDADGRIVDASITDPALSSDLAPKVSGVMGLNGFARWHPHNRPLPRAQKAAVSSSSETAHTTGCSSAYASSDGLTPAQIGTAYGTSSIGKTGSGETLALMELDGFTSGDITCYESSFGLAAVPITTVLVDGYNGAAGEGSDEVTLDIELAIAMAPGLSSLRVYEGQNTDQGVLDLYSRIASDNVAKTVSTSWGAAEDTDTSSYFTSEKTIFAEMAAQGQSVFSAAGDSGAYDDSNSPSTLEVDDPGSQVYVTSVGGTSLTTSGGAYGSETTWNDGASDGAGGGGISRLWSIPSWQSGLATGANLGSSSMRMVPDVSMEADPNHGYAIYYTDGSGNTDCGSTGTACWMTFGGTSCAAPLWAAFMSIVNQGRVAASETRMGFINSTIYTLAQSSSYSSTFHDVTSGTNLYYPAETGYDLATGWGSMRGAALYNALVSGTATASSGAPSVPTNVTVTVIQ